MVDPAAAPPAQEAAASRQQGRDQHADKVKAMQMMLQAAGFDIGKKTGADGKYGKNTHKALMQAMATIARAGNNLPEPLKELAGVLEKHYPQMQQAGDALTGRKYDNGIVAGFAQAAAESMMKPETQQAMSGALKGLAQQQRAEAYAIPPSQRAHMPRPM